MSLKIKDFIQMGLDEDIARKRFEIRCIKKEIRHLENMKAAARNITEKEFLKLVGEDSDILEKYNRMKEAVEDKQKAEIKKMVKEGKLKEIFYDKDGKQIILDEPATEGEQ